MPACGVVWKEAPESAIHSVLTGGVRPMALKDCANRGAAPALAAPAAIDCPLKALAANGAAAGGHPECRPCGGERGSGPRGVPGRNGLRGARDGLRGGRGGEGGGGPRGLRGVRGGRDGGHKGCGGG